MRRLAASADHYSAIDSLSCPPRDAPELAATPDAFVLRGGSAILGPNGKYMVEPVFEEEAIIVAELDLNAVDREKMTLDVSGHYSRPDIFSFQNNQRTRRAKLRRE